MGANPTLLGSWPSSPPPNETPRSNDTHTRRSSISSESSESSGASASSAQKAVQISNQTPSDESRESLSPKATSGHPVDPLSRSYPKPTEELDLREALRRKPGRWTLGHYINETPVRGPGETSQQDEEKTARDVETKKQDLLKAKEEIRLMALPK